MIQEQFFVDNIINKFILVIFLLSTNVCFAISDYPKFADKIVSDYTKELSQQNIYLIGSGGAMMSDIQKINVHYISNLSCSVKEARTIYIMIAKEYLRRINNNKLVRPYLHNYPFNFFNLKLQLSFENSTKGSIAFIFQGKNSIICYAVYDQKDELNVIHQETYEEALQICEEHSNYLIKN